MTRIGVALLGLTGVCLFLASLSALSNRNLPDEDRADRLSALDKSRLAEALQLKSALGDQVWQGWGSAEIPVIVWNRSQEFLCNFNGEAPSGWDLIKDADLNGSSCFRRAADDPQNFAVRVGDRWTASIATKRTTDVFLIDTFRDQFPAPLKQIFPYRFLIQPSETQIGGLLHETFHAHQYQRAPERMKKAESIHEWGEEYEAAAEDFKSEWKKESALLADALKAQTQEGKIALIQQFLSVRDARRNDHRLNPDLIDYERWLEWEEGTAKYVEVAILKAASEDPDYQPLPEMKDDPDFKGYQKTDGRWSQEMFQLRYQTSSGETQFYMTGMAQAFLLDELLPDWQEKYWNENIFLEDLLQIAVAGREN